MTKELIEKLEELDKNATRFPWGFIKSGCDDGPGVFAQIITQVAPYHVVFYMEDSSADSELPSENDLKLIVDLRNSLPEILTALRENERLRNAVEWGLGSGDSVTRQKCLKALSSPSEGKS